METSPAELNDAGRFEVTAVVETEKREEPLSVIFKRLPVVSPLAPMLILKRSPEAVAVVEGDQSMDMSLPEERAVEMELRLKAFPVDSWSEMKLKELADEALEVAVSDPL